MARLFVAVWPPAELVAQLETLPRPPVAGLRWTTRDQWHVTLRFLGDVDGAAAGAVAGAVASVAVAWPAPVAARAGPATGRFGHRILYVPVDGLGPLAHAVAAATAGFGQPPDERPFAGHLTLARARDRARVDLRPLQGTALAAGWPVDELTLVESRLSPAGARYSVVARSSLPAAGPAPN